MSLMLILLVVGATCCLLWLIGGVAFKAIPSELSTACLIIWIFCGIGIIVLSVAGHGLR